MEVGSYAHRPIFHHPDDIPSNEESRAVAHRAAVHARRLRPADGGGDRADGDARRRRDQVRHQRPAVAHARRDAGARRDARGAQPVVGRRGVGQGRPRHRPARGRVDDVRLPAACATRTGRDIARFYPHERTEHHIYARCAEHFNKTYGIVHPREQWASQRGMRRSPFYAREEALGAVFFDARGLGAPAVVRVERRPDGTATPASASRVRTSGTPAGGRRSPTPSTSTCASTSAWST